MTFGFNIEEAEVAPGTLGLLYDSTPQLTTADVKPFVWAILLFRGAVVKSEVIGAITPICAHSELYSGCRIYRYTPSVTSVVVFSIPTIGTSSLSRSVSPPGAVVSLPCTTGYTHTVSRHHEMIW